MAFPNGKIFSYHFLTISRRRRLFFVVKNVQARSPKVFTPPCNPEAMKNNNYATKICRFGFFS